MKNAWNKKKIGQMIVFFCCILMCLTGCGKQSDGKTTKVVLTTGFEKDEIFRIESVSCKLPEVMVYLTNTQNQYEKTYGDKIWSSSLKGVSLEQNVKDMVLAKLTRIKIMTLLAEKYQVTLTEQEQKLTADAAEKYYGTLSKEEIEGMGVDCKTIEKMYAEYALANKVYQYIIRDINPEISDDEARTITVQNILIKTYTLDGLGKRVPLTGTAKKEAEKRAEEVCARAKNGEDFDQLTAQYNEDSKSIYSFGTGEMDAAFEKAAFELGNDEISDVVETEYGYHIIKCISTFNQEETDANKVKIVEKRKKEVFGQEYDAFVAPLAKNLNRNLWKEVTFLHDDKIKTSDFFQVYSSFFGEI